MKNKDFKQVLCKRYAGTPMELYDSKYLLSDSDRALYSIIHSGAQNTKELYAYAPRSYYCRVLGCSETEYYRRLNNLIEEGVVTVERTYGGTSRIYPKYIIPTKKNKAYVSKI